MDDTGFTADLWGNGKASKVNQESINRGGSCSLYLPSLTESLPTCSFPITSGVEGTQCHKGIQIDNLRLPFLRILHLPSE